MPGAAEKVHTVSKAFQADFLAKCQAASGRNIDGAFTYKLDQSAFEDKELCAYQPRSGGTIVQID